jgi:hypothetical protein
MHVMGVNLYAVLVCALVDMVAGFVWYSPALFAKPWTILMGYDPNDKAKMEEMRKGAGASYGISTVASILAAIVLGKIIAVANVTTALYGMEIGLAIWLGIVTTVQLTGALFSRQPFKLYLINTGYQAVCYVAMGAILGGWR